MLSDKSKLGVYLSLIGPKTQLRQSRSMLEEPLEGAGVRQCALE